MSTSTCQVEIDGAPLPADVEPLLAAAYVDDSQRLPDMFLLRFRDPDRVVLAKSRAEVGAVVRISVTTAAAPAPALLIHGEITAVEAEFDTSGTFTVIRGYDPGHRLFRGRRTVSYVQMTASDIARTVAQRAGLRIGTVTSTTTVFPHVSQAGQTDWELLQQLARDTGFEVAVREGTFRFSAPTTAAEAPAAGARTAGDPLVLHLGTDLLRFRSVLTSAQQAGKVEVRGWDVASKRALTATAEPATRSAELPTVTPAELAAAFGNPTYVATEVPYRSQAEVDEAAASLAEEIAAAFAEFEGVARGNPRLRAGTAISVAGLGEPFDGKYTVTTSRHRFDPSTGYTTALSVTGRQDRSLLGLASGGTRSTPAPAGVVTAVVSDVADPEHQGRVRLTFPWLDEAYVSDWARTVHAGAGKDRGWTVLPEVGDEVAVCFDRQFDRPVVLGGFHNGVDPVPGGSPDLVDAGSGAVNRRSLVSRLGHRIDLLDQDGKTEGVRLSTKDDKLTLVLDSVGTTVTVHADGKVLVEGSQGITLDAASADLALKAGTIALKASNGVTVDGGGGAVSVKAGAALSLSGLNATLEGSANAEVKGGAVCSVSAALVKIN